MSPKYSQSLRHLIANTSGLLALQSTSIVVTFTLSVLLARSMGLEQYGLYSYAIGIAGLLALLGTSGAPTLIVRHTAAYLSASDHKSIHGLWRWANRWVLTASLAAITIGSLFLALSERGASTVHPTLWLSLCLIPVLCYASLNSAKLRGLGMVVLAQTPERVGRPLTFAILVLAALYFHKHLTALEVLAFQIAATTGSLALGLGLLALKKPHTSSASKRRAIDSRAHWSRAVLPLMLLSASQLVRGRVDIVMVGALANTDLAGVYRVAVKGSEFVSLILLSINLVTQPRFAALAASRDAPGLQTLATTTARLALVASAPVALVFIILRGHLLGGIYGPDFAAGGKALAILSAAQLCSAAFGSVGVMLTMSGHERNAATAAAVGAGGNVVLNFVLIPLWGIEGAALGTAISILVTNFLLAASVRRHMGIHPSAIAWRRHSIKPSDGPTR